MYAYPLISSGSHPSNEKAEYMLLEHLGFPQTQPPAEHIHDPNALEGVGKKWLRKAMERERRNDMRSRYSALTSLLPDENIRGKTTIIDQLSEAADYIGRLQVKVEELASKRDDMKKMNLKSKSYKKQKVYNALPGNESEAFPLVNLNLLGSRLVIAVNTLAGQIVLWKLLLAVEEEGLQVLTATSSATGNKVFYTLHCKVSDVKSFTTGTELHQKLLKMIG